MNFSKTKEINSGYQNLDFTNSVKMSSLLNEFSDLATTHAIELKMWKPEVFNQYGWIVSKIHVQLDTQIQQNYTLKTMIGTHSNVIFPRYFEIYQQGNKIGAGSTIWTMLDLQKRRIIRPSRAGFEIPDNPDLIPPCELPDTIEEVDYQFIEERKVRYSDIDTNMHMNNTKYIDWACDLIGIDQFRNNYISTLDIYFIHEIAPDTLVQLYKYKDQNTIYIKGNVEETECFKVKLQFKQK